MAIQLQQGGKVVPVINVTPLVDVVLVLLIIFMVIVPLLEKEMIVNLPADTRSEATPPPANDQILIDLQADGKVTVAGVVVARDRLEATIADALAGRERRVVFFAADDEARYGDAVAVLDAARGAGAETIGTVLSASAGNR
jgi:biopolymer transport protein ExbD